PPRPRQNSHEQETPPSYLAHGKSFRNSGPRGPRSRRRPRWGAPSAAAGARGWRGLLKLEIDPMHFRRQFAEQLLYVGIVQRDRLGCRPALFPLAEFHDQPFFPHAVRPDFFLPVGVDRERSSRGAVVDLVVPAGELLQGEGDPGPTLVGIEL